MRTVTYNLQQLLADAKRKAFVIPRFQRKFVWNQSQVKLLIDSIARNYPIGSLLLLQETDAVPFLASRAIDADVDDYSSDVGSPAATPGCFYVLDGQQRLTSLVRVLLQATPNSRYYFDLHAMNEIDNSARNPSAWIVKHSSNKKLSLGFLPSDFALDKDKSSVRVQQFFLDEEKPKSHEDRAKQFEAAAKVSGYFETIRNFQVPLVIIDRSDSIEAICRIFETINSTGTRLTTFDLAVARYFPEPDLQQLWSDVQEKYPVLKQFEVEGERLLQVIALIDGYEKSESFEKRAYFEITRGALLQLDRKVIEGKWEIASKSLADAYSWAEEHGGVPGLLANEALLVPLAFFYTQVTEGWKHKNPAFIDILRRWYFANILQQGATQQAGNYRVALLSGHLRDWLIGKGELVIPEVVLRANDVLSLSKTDNRYRAIHALMRWNTKKDIWTGELLDIGEVEDHHIFPASCARRSRLNKKQLDSIANRILVSKETNRRLSDRMPDDYIVELMTVAQTRDVETFTRDLLEKACIPTDIAPTVPLFAPFLEARAHLILAMCRRLIGERFRSDGPNLNEVGFDEDHD